MRGNLDRINADLERLRGDAGQEQREGQRRSILVALAQNNCGAQYRAAVASAPPQQQRSSNLFEALFGPGPGSILAPSPGEGGFMGGSGAYRTVCVRTCDGFFYPISFSTNASRFGEDEKACQKSCPAAEVMLFSHRNPGEDINQAVSTAGGRSTRRCRTRSNTGRRGTTIAVAAGPARLGRDDEERRRHHRRARRHRRQRPARPAIVAAALRRAGPAGPARACVGHVAARPRPGPHQHLLRCKRHPCLPPQRLLRKRRSPSR